MNFIRLAAILTLTISLMTSAYGAEVDDTEAECLAKFSNQELCAKRSVQAFFIASKLVGDMMDACQSPAEIDVRCKLDAKEDNLLYSMASQLKTHRDVVVLDFKSEKANPGFFFLDNQVRVAKTSDAPKETIYINTDMITGGKVDIGEAVAILVHELGHHYKVKDHQYLDRLGAKVKALMEKLIISATVPTEWGGDFEFTLFNVQTFWHRMSSGPTRNGRLILWDTHRYIDLSAQLWSFLCTDPKLRTQSFGAINILADELTKPAHAIKVRLSTSFICMPSFGIGQNHFDLNSNGTFTFEQVSGRWQLEKTSPSWSIRSCREDQELPCF